jgi:hypothetical protein
MEGTPGEIEENKVEPQIRTIGGPDEIRPRQLRNTTPRRCNMTRIRISLVRSIFCYITPCSLVKGTRFHGVISQKAKLLGYTFTNQLKYATGTEDSSDLLVA